MGKWGVSATGVVITQPTEMITKSGYNYWYQYLVKNTVMEREAITIRFPTGLLAKARNIKEGSESLNDLIVEAVEREVRRRRAWAAHKRIITRSDAVKAKTGIQPASTKMIRSLREGTATS